MDRPISRIIIAGGGTAGWLSAARLAAWSKSSGSVPLDITLVEAPDIPTIGVGEGTWPTFRETLSAIGIEEDEFLATCDSSFKQGSRFDGWLTGSAGDRYFHPFTAPPATDPRELVAAWKAAGNKDFAHSVCAQPSVCELDLAPRQRNMPAGSGALNYAYHFDASKLVEILRRHAVGRLGVKHVAGRIERIESDGADGIAALLLADGTRIAGDLFIDCTGLKAVLAGEHLGGGWVDRSDVMFNDRALAAQVAVEPGSPIASQTIGTAHDHGWIWDIGLQTRRGIGCVYASQFCSDEEARQTLDGYIAARLPGAGEYPVRAISFPTGYRQRFWTGNCIAVGMAAGFIEPLEASAIVMVELSINALTEGFPENRGEMDFLARRFNQRFTQRWERIVGFLKLHYVLSRRRGRYWDAHRDPSSFPERLGDLIGHWRNHPPSILDLELAEEIFPAASYQYVYYGMGGVPPARLPEPPPALTRLIGQLAHRARAMHSALPGNRAYLDALAERHGLPMVEVVG
ncbi:MAG: tryptophan halogenase family protein [Pseudomonadota bacterium]